MRRPPRHGIPVISYCDICGTSTGLIRVYPYKKGYLCGIHYAKNHDAEASKWYEKHVNNLTEGIEDEFNTGD